MTVRTIPRGLPRRQPAQDKSFSVVDLTGGLDLYRDGAQLEPNFSSDMMNVDPLVGGGVKRRKGVTIYTAEQAPGKFDALSTHVITGAIDNGWQFVLGSIGGSMYLIRKSGLTLLTTAGVAGPSTVWRSFQVYDKSYIYDSNMGIEWCRSFTVATRLGASTVVPIAPAFNPGVPKYGYYGVGGIPICRAMTFWHGRVWGAATVESGVRYDSRIRWSFPIVNNLGVGDWHPDDYLTADESGDPIHTLVPQGDRLLIFKAGSVDQITGWDETNFVRTTVLHDAGASSPDAITVLGGSVYFWDTRLGLCRFTSEGFDVLATRILPLVQKVAPPVVYEIAVDPAPGAYVFGPNLSLAAKPATQIFLGAVADRIWCSVVRTDANNTAIRQTLVFDPKLGAGAGAWLLYDLQVGPFVTAHKEGFEQYGLDYLAGSRDATVPYRLLRLEIDDLDVDDFGSALRSIPSWFRTGWLADGSPFKRKRWGLVQAILDAGDAQSFGLETYADWDEKTLEDSLVFNNPAALARVFTTDRSLLAPTAYELKRPVGMAGPGANALYPIAATTTVATWDDPTVTWDSPDRDWAGNYYTSPAAGVSSDVYSPVVPLPAPCPGASTYDKLSGGSRTGYEFQNLNMPACRAVQFLVVGALPSKEWSLRGIMVTYREVEG